MADTRVEMASDDALREHLAAGLTDFFQNYLGPAIREDAARLAPRLSGRLANSIDDEVRRDGNELPYLIVGTFPDADGPIDYSAAVEFGFHGPEVVRAHMRNGHPVREHMRQGNSPEQPYLRPAAYRIREP